LVSEKFSKALTEVWIPRSELKEEIGDEIDLKQEFIAGRRAHDRR